MTRLTFALPLALSLALALPAHAAKPAKGADGLMTVRTLGTWKVRCSVPTAAPAARRCTLGRGYLPPILEIDDKGVRLVEGDPKSGCRPEPWRYKLDGRDLATVPAADRPKLLLAGHELTRERQMGRRCTFRRERVNIGGIRLADRFLQDAWRRLTRPAAGARG